MKLFDLYGMLMKFTIILALNHAATVQFICPAKGS